METAKIAKIFKIINAIDVLGLIVLLIIAFGIQVLMHELPCPLCTLQRIGILAIAFGFLLNVQFRIHPAHYALSLLASLLTATIAVRQVFLHLMPGDPGYGPAFFGLHLYTWVFLFCVAVITYIAIIFSIFPQYKDSYEKAKPKSLRILTHITFGAVLLLTIANGISTYMICGFKECPENPVKYILQF